MKPGNIKHTQFAMINLLDLEILGLSTRILHLEFGLNPYSVLAVGESNSDLLH